MIETISIPKRKSWSGNCRNPSERDAPERARRDASRADHIPRLLLAHHGVLALVRVFVDRSVPWIWSLLIGIVAILAGIFVLRDPLLAVLTVPTAFVIILGVLGLVMGVFEIIGGMRGAGIGAFILGVIGVLVGLLLLSFAHRPDSTIGPFSDALLPAVKQRGWVVISVQNDWQRLFAFENQCDDFYAHRRAAGKWECLKTYARMLWLCHSWRSSPWAW